MKALIGGGGALFDLGVHPLAAYAMSLTERARNGKLYEIVPHALGRHGQRRQQPGQLVREEGQPQRVVQRRQQFRIKLHELEVARQRAHLAQLLVRHVGRGEPVEAVAALGARGHQVGLDHA